MSIFDFELTKKGIEPLESFTRKTKTTVHRMVTHEPFPRFTAFVSDGTKPPMLTPIETTKYDK